MVSTEQDRARRGSARKMLMNGVFALIVAGGLFIFFASLNNAPETQDVASQEMTMPAFDPQPAIVPPDEPLPAPTIPPVPLPDATPTPGDTPVQPAPLP